nr:MAG TPA: hypothetical protein [Caudoviricetes sp.]
MGKLKELREKRATVFTEIDELYKTTDGREMTAEEKQRWDTLLADRRVTQEERFEEMERRQAEQTATVWSWSTTAFKMPTPPKMCWASSFRRSSST